MLLTALPLFLGPIGFLLTAMILVVLVVVVARIVFGLAWKLALVALVAFGILWLLDALGTGI